MLEKIKNERGLTLIEVLGVLVLTVFILGFLTYFLQYSSLSLKQVSSREQSLQQSRDIVNHVVNTVRSGLIPESLSGGTSSGLKLIGVNGQFAEYTFNAAEHTLSVQYQLLDDDGHLAARPTTVNFSERVKNIAFATIDGKVEVTLEVYLPNNQTQVTSTVVHTTQR